MAYVLVRSAQAGVFAGNLEKREGSEVTLLDARRIWSWSGAASLSQLAVDGTKEPRGCKFPVAVPRILILGVCEIIDVTPKGEASIRGVPEWSA